jgi:2-aminoadipate transaminase
MLIEQEDKVRTELWRVSQHMLELKSSIIREILKISSQPGVISFAGGLPAPELFPVEELKEVAAHVLDTYGPNCLQYSVSRGIVPLREELAQRAEKIGIPTTPNNILICSGAQQAIEVIGRTFLEPGDYILTENPTYVGALQAFNCYQARYAPVEMDEEGMIMDQVAEQIERYKPKLVYTVTNFQNPTGITMSLKRREQLVEICSNFNTPIVDDNPYGQIRFDGEEVRDIKAIGGDQVISLSTFSKTLAPGLRIGWMNGAEDMIAIFEKVKQSTDLHTSTFSQFICYEFVHQGKLDRQIERIKPDYRRKRDTMLQAMRDVFPEGIKWTEPEGGLFLWVELPKHMSAKDLLPKAIDLKVAYVYGQPFFPKGDGENTLRLNFSNATLEGIVEGITRLGKLFAENM